MPLVLLGKIIRLQIQLESPIWGERPNRVYAPKTFMSVQAMTLTRRGALVHTPDGHTILDIHHAYHPQTRNDEDTNTLLVNFTAHYAAMCCGGRRPRSKKPCNFSMTACAGSIARSPRPIR